MMQTAGRRPGRVKGKGTRNKHKGELQKQMGVNLNSILKSIGTFFGSFVDN